MKKMNKVALERRKHRRSKIETAIGVTFTLPEKSDEVMGMVNDISPNGLGVATSIGIPSETLLDITIGEGGEKNLLEADHFIGEVRWCQPDPLLKESYNLGIRIRDLPLR